MRGGACDRAASVSVMSCLACVWLKKNAAPSDVREAMSRWIQNYPQTSISIPLWMQVLERGWSDVHGGGGGAAPTAERERTWAHLAERSLQCEEGGAAAAAATVSAGRGGTQSRQGHGVGRRQLRTAAEAQAQMGQRPGFVANNNVV